MVARSRRRGGRGLQMYDLICSTRSSGVKYQLHLEWLALVVSVCVVVAPSTASGRRNRSFVECVVSPEGVGKGAWFVRRHPSRTALVTADACASKARDASVADDAEDCDCDAAFPWGGHFRQSGLSALESDVNSPRSNRPSTGGRSLRVGVFRTYPAPSIRILLRGRREGREPHAFRCPP